MSKDTNQILGHAEDNDGIEEYDNPLPDWWVGMFFFTVVFAFGYTLEYHFVSGRSQAGMYDEQMAAAEARWPKPATPTAVSMDAASVEAGKVVFTQTCAPCHGANLQGGIGPSLVDATWIHGNAPEQVLKTITEGVTAKGMPAWGPVLGPEKVSKVAAYVLTQAAAAPAEAAPAPTEAPPAQPVGDPAQGVEAAAANPAPAAPANP